MYVFHNLKQLTWHWTCKLLAHCSALCRLHHS